MNENKPGFWAQVRSYPSTFWIANTMEIFERMAWYGFYTVSSLYITAPVVTGGLGFSSEQRGQIQAIVPFILYLLPVITGALADRYGYKKMFLTSYVGMIVFYYALGQFKTFPTFLMAFLFVALAAAIFKPVVVGTIARVTDESNSAMGFGFFYMMVNIGGFIGPMVAGAMRGWSWDYVFITCSIWAAINLIICLFFYKDPSTEAKSSQKRTLKKVTSDMMEVLGNLRFGICVFVVLIALMIANQEFENFRFWPHCTVFIAIWLVFNFFWDRALPRGSGDPHSPIAHGRRFWQKRMHCSNWRFALYLLILSGFWTSFQQIFLTMPEYIRDYVDSRPLVEAGRWTVQNFNGDESWWIDRLAAIEEKELLNEFDSLLRQARGQAPLVASTEAAEPPVNSAAALLKQANTYVRDADTTQDMRTELGADIIALRNMLQDTKERTPTESNQLPLAEIRQRLDNVQRDIRRRKLLKLPSLTQNDIDQMQSLLSEINSPNTDQPLEVIDLVEASKTILQYKVRVTPVEVGELVASIPEGVTTIQSEYCAEAIESLNKQLEKRGDAKIDDPQNEDHFCTELEALVVQSGPVVSADAASQKAAELSTQDRPIDVATIAPAIRDLAYRPFIWTKINAGRQVNPEYIVNIDALSIVLLQVLISFMMARFHRFTTMIVGMIVAAVGIGLSALAGGTMLGPIGGMILVVIVGIVIFAIGEMMASPTSQEYIGRIAPKDRVAVYMGYYFVAVALGNLFGGILSGQLYGTMARDWHRPDLMWLTFAGIMAGTALVFLLYNKLVVSSGTRPSEADSIQ